MVMIFLSLQLIFIPIKFFFFLNYKFHLMTEVVVAQEELELVNIVEIVQSKLTKNFTILLRRLNQHDIQITKQAQRTQQIQLNNESGLQRIEEVVAQQNKLINQRLDELFRKMAGIEEVQDGLKVELGDKGIGVKRLTDQLFNTQLQFEEKMKVKEQQMAEITRHIEILVQEQARMNEEINKKENKVEAQKIVKETQILKDKNVHFEGELKVAHHKIEKMEILSQKAERIQAKKDVEIIKEIEERVKKEIKINLGGTPANTANGGNSVNNISTRPSQLGQREVLHKQSYSQYKENEDTQTPNKRSSIFMDDSAHQNSEYMRNNFDLILQKWGEKIKYFEVQLKEVNENLKILNKNSSGKKTEMKESGNSSEGIKQKINQIKPEIIKLWAKLDTVQDRLAFNQRKLEEKLKGINELTIMIKQNNASRLQQKLKNLQTQIFTNLKEVKAKLETKVAQTEYDKYCHSIDDRIVQINEMIYLKSDKLQVKKALLFLQSKIKQIILVISEDEENEKDALLTKKQLKCISCDKEIDKFSGVVSSPKGNWDGLPFKDHPPEILGRFGMTNFGSLAKKIKKLEGKDLPILNKRNVNQSFQNSS